MPACKKGKSKREGTFFTHSDPMEQLFLVRVGKWLLVAPAKFLLKEVPGGWAGSLLFSGRLSARPGPSAWVFGNAAFSLGHQEVVKGTSGLWGYSGTSGVPRLRTLAEGKPLLFPL